MVMLQRVNNHGGRPKASDYDDVAQEAIATAVPVFRSIMTQHGAFPDHTRAMDYLKEAWKYSLQHNELPPLQLTPDVAKMVSVTCSFNSTDDNFPR